MNSLLGLKSEFGHYWYQFRPNSLWQTEYHSYLVIIYDRNKFIIRATGLFFIADWSVTIFSQVRIGAGDSQLTGISTFMAGNGAASVCL